MNKFTRSQMGKIMAYALSAAMAVTVVPTYMMKPLVAEAATVTTTGANEIQKGKELTIASTSDKTRIALFAKGTTPQTGDKAVYVFKEVAAGTTKLPIPYDVPTGTYYIGIYSDTGSVTDKVAASSTSYTIDPTETVKINDATAVTGLTLSASNTNIYNTLPASGSSIVSNQEYINVNLLGGDNKTYESVSVTAYSSSASKFVVGGTTVASTTSSTPTPISNVDISKPISVTLDDTNVNSEVDGDTVTVEVKIKVVGRENEIVKKIQLKAVKGLVPATTILVTADKEVVATGETAVLKTNVAPANSQQNILYSIKGTNTVKTDGTTPADTDLEMLEEDNIIKLVDKTGGSDTTKADSKDLVYAIFDKTTGELTTKRYGDYEVTAYVDKNKDGKLNAAPGDDTVLGPKTITAASFVINDVVPSAGDTATTSGSITVYPANSSNLTNVYADYSVDNTDIATISGTTDDFAVKPVSAGITKINAKIKVYANVGYDFETTGYVVVQPDINDNDFEITSVPNTEIYANRLAKNNKLTGNLPLQLADAINNGQVDAKILKKEAMEQASAEIESDLSSYYTITDTDSNTLSTVTANGLLFAAYNPDVVAEESPEKSVKVKLVVTDLHAEDEVYKVEDSVVDFVAEMTVDNKVEELQKPVWLTVENANLENGKTYTVYDNGEAIYTAKAATNTQTGKVELAFQTDSFSVFSIVETPDAELTDNEADIDKPDTPDSDDIYDKVNFSAHVQRRIGTDDEADIAATVSDNGIISLGTHGQSRRVEKITLTGLDADEVEMTAHVQKRVDHPEDIADLTQVVNEDGSISIGTEHQSRRIEAFSMNLKGDLAEKYDVYYRVHAQNYGWLGWAKNGEIAGTSGHSFRLEGIEIIFVEKGTEFDESQYVKTPEEGDRGYSEKAAYMYRVVSEK